MKTIQELRANKLEINAKIFELDAKDLNEKALKSTGIDREILLIQAKISSLKQKKLILEKERYLLNL